MKNILEILQEAGIELTEEQQKSVNKSVLANYKTINDYNAQVDKVKTVTEQLTSSQSEFEEFKKSLNGLDPKDYQTKIDEYENKLNTQKADYEKKISSMTLESTLKDMSSEFGCVDFDLAKTQLDIDALLSSKEQTEDIKSAFTKLKESKPYLFAKEEETKPNSKGHIIGGSGSTEPNENIEELNMRSIMGLPTTTGGKQ